MIQGPPLDLAVIEVLGVRGVAATDIADPAKLQIPIDAGQFSLRVSLPEGTPHGLDTTSTKGWPPWLQKDHADSFSAATPADGSSSIYFCFSGDRVRISASLDSLTATLPRLRFRQSAVLHYLSLRGAPDIHALDAGLIDEILQVPPGYTLVISSTIVRLVRWWHLPHQPNYLSLGPTETAELVRGALKACLRAGLHDSAGVGVLASGGLDSSVVASFAVQVLGRQQVRLLSCSGPHRTDEETRRLQTLAEYLTITTTHVEHDQTQSLVATLRSHNARSAYPCGGFGSAFIETLLHTGATAGLSHFLTGEGGDEVFGDCSATLWDSVKQREVAAAYRSYVIASIHEGSRRRALSAYLSAPAWTEISSHINSSLRQKAIILAGRASTRAHTPREICEYSFGTDFTSALLETCGPWIERRLDAVQRGGFTHASYDLNARMVNSTRALQWPNAMGADTPLLQSPLLASEVVSARAALRCSDWPRKLRGSFLSKPLLREAAKKVLPDSVSCLPKLNVANLAYVATRQQGEEIGGLLQEGRGLLGDLGIDPHPNMGNVDKMPRWDAQLPLMRLISLLVWLQERTRIYEGAMRWPTSPGGQPHRGGRAQQSP